MALVVKNLSANAKEVRDAGLIPGSGRSPGGQQPIPVFLPEESHRQRNLTDYSPWGHEELDTTEQRHFFLETLVIIITTRKPEDINLLKKYQNLLKTQ